MHTIALLIQKGGSGKTNIAVSLAAAAAAEGLTAVIIDLDPQATVCAWHDRRVALDAENQNPLCLSAQPARLPAVLKEAADNGVDLAIIDTPAKSSDAALAAAKAAHLVLVPCKPQAFDLDTIEATREIISLAGNKPALAVLNDVPARGDRHEQARQNITAKGLPVCPFTIGHRACFGDAAFFGKAASEYEPKGKGAQECRNVYKYTIRTIRQLAAERNPDNGNTETGSRSARV
jgi:chromosome partitioning protein